MDEPLIRRLRPDVILTQRLCDVCAVGYDSVTAFAKTLPGPPTVVNLEPASLADIFDDIRRVAAATGVSERAEQVVASLAARVEAVRTRAARRARVRAPSSSNGSTRRSPAGTGTPSSSRSRAARSRWATRGGPPAA